MKPNEVRHLGDGAYLEYDGYGYKLMANSHENPTDIVYLEPEVLANLMHALGYVPVQMPT